MPKDCENHNYFAQIHQSMAVSHKPKLRPSSAESVSRVTNRQMDGYHAPAEHLKERERLVDDVTACRRLRLNGNPTTAPAAIFPLRG
jgi:hypothetical protein